MLYEQKPHEKLKPLQAIKAILDIFPATNLHPSPEVTAIFKKFVVPPSSPLSVNLHIVVNKNT